MTSIPRYWPSDIQSNFITHEELRPDRFYIKNKNKVAVIIDTDSDWNMRGTVVNPLIFPSTYPLSMSDAQCKFWLSGRVAPNRGKKILDSLGISKYDTMSILYRTRGIQYGDDYFLAWSTEDRIEDYHPRHNKDIAEQWFPDISEL